MGAIVSLEMEIIEVGMKLAATGQIVRIDHSEGKVGIGVRLFEPRLEPI